MWERDALRGERHSGRERERYTNYEGGGRETRCGGYRDTLGGEIQYWVVKRHSGGKREKRDKIIEMRGRRDP